MDEEGIDENITKAEINIYRGCERKLKHEIIQKCCLKFLKNVA